MVGLILQTDGSYQQPVNVVNVQWHQTNAWTIPYQSINRATMYDEVNMSLAMQTITPIALFK